MCKIINQKNINGYSHVKNNLSTGYSLKMWIVYKNVDKIVKNRKNKKEQINIDFLSFFGIMISDAFIINKGGVST